MEGCQLEGSLENRALALVSDGSHGTAVRGNRFVNVVDAGYPEDGVRIEASSRCEVSDTVIDGANWYGIHVRSAPRTTVRRNAVRRPGRVRSDSGPTVSGILLDNAPGSRIVDNRVHDCGGYGIGVCLTRSQAAQPVLVARNSIARCDDPGITVQASERVIVQSNRVHDASWGFTIGEESRACRHVQVRGNEFSSCPYAGGFVQGSDRCEVSRNVFLGCGEARHLTPHADALLVLWDGAEGRGTSRTRVERNVAYRGHASSSRLPRLFVRRDGGSGFHAANTRGNVVRGNQVRRGVGSKRGR